MKKYLLAGIAALVTAVPAAATTDNAGYVGLEGGILFPQSHSIQGEVTFTGTNAVDFSRTTVDNQKYKKGLDLDFIGGYDFGMFRVEGELGYKHAKAKDLNPGETIINAINTATGRRNSVRVDGEVLGAERITSPAGAFDTVKVKRRVYAGDFAGAKSETNITETDWFAPALGRPVRKETNSGYMDQQRCSDEMSACTQVRGAWLVLELVEVRPGGR